MRVIIDSQYLDMFPLLHLLAFRINSFMQLSVSAPSNTISITLCIRISRPFIGLLLPTKPRNLILKILPQMSGPQIAPRMQIIHPATPRPNRFSVQIPLRPLHIVPLLATRQILMPDSTIPIHDDKDVRSLSGQSIHHSSPPAATPPSVNGPCPVHTRCATSASGLSYEVIG